MNKAILTNAGRPVAKAQARKVPTYNQIEAKLTSHKTPWGQSRVATTHIDSLVLITVCVSIS